MLLIIATILLMFGFHRFYELKFSTSMPYLIREFELNKATALHANSFYFLGLTIGIIVFGIIAHRIGKKRTVYLGGLISMCSTIACFLSPTIGLFLYFRLMAGFGNSIFSVMAHAFTRSYFAEHNRAKTYAINIIFLPLASIAAPFVSGYMCPRFGFRSIFIVDIFLLMVVLFCVCIFLSESPYDRPSRDQSKNGLELAEEPLVGLSAEIKNDDDRLEPIGEENEQSYQDLKPGYSASHSFKIGISIISLFVTGPFYYYFPLLGVSWGFVWATVAALSILKDHSKETFCDILSLICNKNIVIASIMLGLIKGFSHLAYSAGSIVLNHNDSVSSANAIFTCASLGMCASGLVSRSLLERGVRVRALGLWGASGILGMAFAAIIIYSFPLSYLSHSYHITPKILHLCYFLTFFLQNFVTVMGLTLALSKRDVDYSLAAGVFSSLTHLASTIVQMLYSMANVTDRILLFFAANACLIFVSALIVTRASMVQSRSVAGES